MLFTNTKSFYYINAKTKKVTRECINPRHNLVTINKAGGMDEIIKEELMRFVRTKNTQESILRTKNGGVIRVIHPDVCVRFPQEIDFRLHNIDINSFAVIFVEGIHYEQVIPLLEKVLKFREEI